MKLSSQTLIDGQPVPESHAFAVIDPEQHVALAANRSPQLAWSQVPEGTASFAVVCHDADAPSQGDDVNQEGREVPADLPRVDFFHWLLWNLPADCRELAAGTYGDGVVAGGKPGPAAAGGALQGKNDYSGWFAGDADMAGDYYGYDGPCPPWNDARVHRYVFTVYALDVASLEVEGDLSGADLLAAMEGHLLAKASISCHYTLNPRLAT